MDDYCKSCTSIETKAVHAGSGLEKRTGSISFPIYQTATFAHPGLNMTTGYDYSRHQNPTREQVEITVAALENASHGFAFATGMAALTTAFRLFPSGSHIIMSEDLYGGTYRLFDQIYTNYGLEYSFVDMRNIENIKKAIRPSSKAIFFETPTNPTMRVTDIKQVTDLARDNKLITIVDNTFLSPYFQRPLNLGTDIVVHSGTKFLCGHNDTLAGFIVTNNETYADKISQIQNTEGAVLSPFDSWLTLRGIKTLGVRLEKQQKNAMEIALWLKTQKSVEQVYYVGLPEHEGYDISLRQANGFGSMISFKVKDPDTVEHVLKKVKLVMFAESLGGVESLITFPIVQTHSYLPDELKVRLGIDNKLLRLSVGIESSSDIIADLEQALN